MNLTSEKIMIFMKEFNGKPSYSIGVSNTNANGQKEYLNIPVNFKGETYVPDKSLIKIGHAFLTCYKAKDGSMKPKIVVMQYEMIQAGEETQEQPKEDVYQDFGNQVNIKAEDLDIPF